ncbi:MAG TPA: DUF4230 domain-containing protein [Ferruginibacter sp.]|jgi:hypothetical protein|nr:DUF4230 domain-containing protein [Ferruginibacter sp.]
MSLKTNLLFLMALTLLLHSCNTKERQMQEVMVLQQMSELATAQYVVTKIIKANDNRTWYKYGDRKILMSCRATLTSGIDLAAITPNNIRIDGKDIDLQLPHAKLISLNIKPEDVQKVYEADDLFRDPFSSAERNAMAIQAEDQIKNSVDSLGVLQTGEKNATLFITNFLTRLGYKKITIHFA